MDNKLTAPGVDYLHNCTMHNNLTPHSDDYLRNQPINIPTTQKITSDGTTASYYELPPNATELQDLISYKNLNAQMGEIFRAVYRYGEVAHSPKLRDAKKIRFYIEKEIERLELYENGE